MYLKYLYYLTYFWYIFTFFHLLTEKINGKNIQEITAISQGNW
jgi:hypothetical protein